MKLDELPTSPAKPRLLRSGAKDVRGLDLLGLRTPAEGVAVRLLDGVTTVTPTVRYLGLRSWIILSYLNRGGMNDWKSFARYAAKIESAIAFAGTLGGDTTVGLVGRDAATARLPAEGDSVTLTRLTKILAVSVYAGPSINLGLGDTQGSVPGLTKERGVPLANEFDRSAKGDAVLDAITPEGDGQSFQRERLLDLGKRLSMGRPEGPERDLILDAVLPAGPRAQELARIASYCLLLHVCGKVGSRVSEADIFDIASASSLDSLPGELHFICDGWTRFLVRDILVLVHEAALNLVLAELSQTPNAEKRRSFREVIAGLVGEDLNPGFAGLGLDGVSADDSISRLYAKVVGAMTGSSEVRGLRRWSGGCREIDIASKSDWLYQPVGLALLPVAWILACHRMEPGVIAQTPSFDIDGLAGSSRMGIGGVLLPEVARWRTSQMTIREVVAWLLKRSVDQHLRIAWSRLAREPHKDVSLLQSDGDEWILVKDFRPGRATSRLYQAVRWLGQLGLIDDSGLTTEGKARLSAGLATLRRAGGVQA